MQAAGFDPQGAAFSKKKMAQARSDTLLSFQEASRGVRLYPASRQGGGTPDGHARCLECSCPDRYPAAPVCPLVYLPVLLH